MHDDLHGGSDPSRPFIEREARFGAHNYAPLPVVLASGQGAWATDVGGRRYLDLMSAYSAVSFGHAHPHIVGALIEQARKLAVTSRAFYNDGLPLLLERITNLTGLARALPSNGGAEAVETALKAMRKWGYRVKGIAPDRAEIIACRGNFHGRTITIVGFSSEAQYRDGFGPFPPGFVAIPYGDAQALADAITPNTAGFLVEPVQGEGGIVVPPDGYLAECARICRERNVLLVCDEIQTGLGRTGYFLGCEHDGVAARRRHPRQGARRRPAAGVAVRRHRRRDAGVHAGRSRQHVRRQSARVRGRDGGARRAGAARTSSRVPRRSAAGCWPSCARSRVPLVADVRGRGLFIGIEIDPRHATARDVVLRLLAHGILSKDTHGTVVRIAPPLTIGAADLAWAVGEIAAVCREIEEGPASGSPL